MNDSEKMAIAARLHVLLRRQSGRVTDVEWMVVNAEYAKAIIQLALKQAQSTKDEDLLNVAQRFKESWQPPAPTVPLLSANPDSSEPAVQLAPAMALPASARYVGGLR